MHKPLIWVPISILLLFVGFATLLILKINKDLVTDMPIASINNVHFEKAFTRPFEPARWVVQVHSTAQVDTTLTVVSRLSYLDQPVTTIEKKIKVSSGEYEVAFEWLPPKETPRGYGLDVSLEINNSHFAIKSFGLDVLTSWTQMPRYGFLSDFEQGRTDVIQTMQNLADLHVNGLQYYDWMYRHETLLTDQEPYIDVLGRSLSIKTVESLIDAGHAKNISAMPYTAIYAASEEFYNQHQDWALYDENGAPVRLGTDFLVYMDPRVDGKWIDHLFSEFEKVLKQTKFDGIHLDQYGDPKEAYDNLGTHIPLDEPIAQTITATHALVDRFRDDGAVVFNCVTNWPVEMASAADEDIIYIEVWDPYVWFSELHNLIAYAQSLGHNKPVVLAAYVHPGSSANPFLMDAIIFSSGGGHIEMGENNGYLADPYFPSYDTLNAEQAALLRRYYDFAVRYQNLIGPSTTEATRQWIDKIKIEGLEVGLNQSADVFALLRESQGRLALNLVNMTNIGSTKWTEPANFPTAATNLHVSVSGMTRTIKSVSFTSADEKVFTLEPLKFIQTGEQVTFEIPSLKIWDLVVFEY